MRNSPALCKIVIIENLTMKLCTRNYIRESTIHATFCFNRFNGASTNYAKYHNFVTFLTVQSLPFFLDLAPMSNRWTDFHALFCGSNDVIPRWSYGR